MAWDTPLLMVAAIYDYKIPNHGTTSTLSTPISPNAWPPRGWGPGSGQERRG
jgi:hypothetical protein